ncbi:MAG: ABC transporter substrate-binding protein [Chromatiales bacterium]|nr:ABC transporter substrate-binding protein [Gammaproteobacteria bacterium]MBW6475685.1 ABC transporter substrate-binding protein [Chromatiales bacterium]
MTTQHKFPLLQYLWLLAALLGTASLQAQANVPPHEMLNQVTERMLETLRAEREAIAQQPSHLFTVVEQVLVPHVEVNVMSRFVLGQHWRRANADQQARFAEEFKNLLVRFYVSALLDDPAQLDKLLASDNIIRFLPVTVPDDTRTTTVRGEVFLPEGGQRVPVSFSMMRIESGQWLLYDVNVDGISLVANYRTSFAADINRDGLDALITRMAERNRRLLDEANGKTSSN